MFLVVLRVDDEPEEVVSSGQKIRSASTVTFDTSKHFDYRLHVQGGPWAQLVVSPQKMKQHFILCLLEFVIQPPSDRLTGRFHGDTCCLSNVVYSSLHINVRQIV